MYKPRKRATSVILSIAVGISCLLGITENGTEAEAAKKAVLKTKKISMQAGTKKKISILRKKKKAKYSFNISKSARKKLSVSKSGVIKAKLAGKAKIKVTERYKKKTRKLGTVTVTIKANAPDTPPVATETIKTAAPTAVSTVSPAPQSSGQPSQPGGNTSAAPTLEPGGDPTNTPAPSLGGEETPAPGNQKVYGNYFEDGELKNLTPRGSATLDISKDANHTEGGQQCLAISDRAATWHGVQLDISRLTEAGSTYEFSIWAKQDSGTTQDISFKFDYTDLDGNHQYAPVTDDVSAASGEWVHLYGQKAIPEYSGNLYLYLEIPTSETEAFMIDDLEIVGKPVSVNSFNVTDEIYAGMKENGVLSTGNNARIKNVIQKARAGEDVTLAYIGGSITEGALASPNAKCYAQVSATAFAEKYGTDGGSNVHFVNAGMSGTPSSLGIIRYDRDVLGQMTTGDYPDILFIEFAVNDYGECTNGGAYEGMIRRALKSGSAVVLVFSVFQSGRVLESDYKKYGQKYDLPMISMGDSIEKYFKEENFFDWFFGDTLHPNNTGYQLMSDCIMNLMDKIDKETAEADNINSGSLPAPLKTTADSYTNIRMFAPDTDITQVDAISQLDAGGFNATDKNTGTFQYPYNGKKGQAWFPKNWMHTKESGSNAFTATVNCKTLMIVYKLSSNKSTGSVDIYVDGTKKKTVSGYSASGWNNATPEVLFTESEAKSHTIELKMASGSEDKEFTLIGFGYSE